MRWCPLRRDFGHLVWEDLLARGPHWEQVSNINEVKYRCPLFTILPYNKQVAITLSLSLQAFLRSNIIITVIIIITICHSPTSSKSIRTKSPATTQILISTWARTCSRASWAEIAWRTTLRSVDTDADIENQDQDQTPDPEPRCATTPVSQCRKSTTKRTTRAKRLDEDTQVGDPDAVYSLLLHYRLVCRFWRGSQAWQEGCAESASWRQQHKYKLVAWSWECSETKRELQIFDVWCIREWNSRSKLDCKDMNLIHWCFW